MTPATRTRTQSFAPHETVMRIDAETDRKFKLSCARYAEMVRQRAEGRTCGSCVHAVRGFISGGICHMAHNAWGKPLKIERGDAVACVEYRGE